MIKHIAIIIIVVAFGLAAPAPAAPAPGTGSAPAPAAQLTGAWGFSTGGAMSPGQFAAWLSDRREYTFDGKGNYTFMRRHNVDRDPDTSIIRERGTYTLVGDVLTLTPAKSEREIWSKVKTGATAGAYDKLLRREQVALEEDRVPRVIHVVPRHAGPEPDADAERGDAARRQLQRDDAVPAVPARR